MIKIKNLSKSFNGTTVLEEVSLEIEKGKLTTLLGENGSGKSTLLNILSGYELPDSGDVTYKKTALSKINFPFVHDIFFVHEKLDYDLAISVEEYVNILKEKIPLWNNNFFIKMVFDRKIDISKNFKHLSRGQKMQVALMIGLASNAKVLLLDEITSVIDVYGRKYFLDLLEKYVEEGNTVVITTNVINELEFYTNNLIVIKNKKIVLNKKIDEIPTHFLKLRRLKGSEHSIFDHPDCIWAGVNSDRTVSYIVPVQLFKDLKIPDDLLDRRKSSLEDVFIYYFSQNKEEEAINENAA